MIMTYCSNKGFSLIRFCLALSISQISRQRRICIFRWSPVTFFLEMIWRNVWALRNWTSSKMRVRSPLFIWYMNCKYRNRSPQTGTFVLFEAWEIALRGTKYLKEAIGLDGWIILSFSSPYYERFGWDIILWSINMAKGGVGYLMTINR